VCYGRPPNPKELEASIEFLSKQRAYHQHLGLRLREQGVDPAEIIEPEKAALIDLCHSLFNSNEFVYIN
jgi:hypothetical protein